MLLALTQWIAQDVRAFNVFQYITLRAVLATLTALAISLLAGPLVIRKLTDYKIGQAVRDDGPQTHLAKAGTPTMGGALVLLSILITTLLWADLSNRFVWVVLVVTFGFGAIGWIDDYRKVVRRDPKGLASRWKFFWTALIALVAAVYLAFAVSASSTDRLLDLFLAWVGSGFSMNLPPKADLIVPFSKNIAFSLGVFGFITLSFFVILGTSHAVNMTDGLDGLAIMPAVMVAGGLAVFAVIVRQEIVLFIMGGLFVAETVSVMIQVLYFKWSGGKRVFRMAPLHHHYELSGWKESQVVVRFWIITMMLVLFGLSTLKLRGVSRAERRWCAVWVTRACRWRSGSRAAGRSCASRTRAPRRRGSRI